MEGTVKWFNKTKGYGFIKGDDGKEYFVHVNDVPPGTLLKDNDPVTFETVKTERGVKAQQVALK